MRDNVIELFAPANLTVEESMDEFLIKYILPWAEANNIDCSTTKFKYSAASIMSILGGLILDD